MHRFDFRSFQAERSSSGAVPPEEKKFGYWQILTKVPRKERKGKEIINLKGDEQIRKKKEF